MKYSIIFGAIYSALALVIGIFVSLIAVSKDYDFLWLYSLLAGFGSATLSYYFLIGRKKKRSNGRLFFVVIFTGIGSHWLCWYLVSVQLYISYYFCNECFYQKPTDPLFSIVGSAITSIWSLLYFGWLTVLVAVVDLYLLKRIKVEKR